MIETRFKQTEIGLIPEAWELRRIDSAFDFVRNNTLSRESMSSTGEVINIHYGDVLVKYGANVDVSSDDVVYINASIRTKANHALKNGDVVVADTAEDEIVGKCCEIIGADSRQVEAGLHTFVLRPKDKYATKFLGYAFNAACYHDQLIPHMQGTKVISISKGAIGKTFLLCPPLVEQERIAKALSDVDTLISDLDALIAKKRDIKQGTMQQLLTGKKRLPGFTDKWNSNAMWELTAWDKFFSEVEKGKQKKVIRYPYLLAANMEAMEQANGNVYLLATGNYEGWTTEEIAGNYLCEGEVVSIPWGGYANIKYTKGKFVTADNRIATSLDTSILDNKYLYYYMLQNKKIFDSFYRGAGIQHPSMADVLDFEILYPSIKEQQAIVTILTDMDNEIQALAAKRDKYTAIKQGMMQELLTGKIRLV